MRLEILLTAILFFGGAFFAGYGLRRVLKLHKEGFLFSIVAGVMVWWALMELILVPMTMKLASFHSFVMVYTIVAGMVSLAGVFCWRDILEDGKELLKNWRQYVTLGHLVALVLICYQLWFLHHHMYLEWDDTYYVNLANEAVWSDKIYWVYPETGAMADFDKRYVLSLWPIFYCMVYKMLIGDDPDNHGTHDPALADHSSGIYGIWAAGKEIVSRRHWSAGNVSGICSTASSLYEWRTYFRADIFKYYALGGKRILATVLSHCCFTGCFGSLCRKKQGRLVDAWDTGLAGCLRLPWELC